MKTISIIPNIIFIALLTFTTTSAFAQHRHGHTRHVVCHRPGITTVVTRPVIITRVNNRASQQEYLNVAISYLKKHHKLTIAKYSSITGLTKAVAEAKLNGFACSKSAPIKRVVNGKKKYYILA